MRSKPLVIFSDNLDRDTGKHNLGARELLIIEKSGSEKNWSVQEDKRKGN